MKIEIEYNGAFATCSIESMDEPGKMVKFNDADLKSQTYALRAFDAIREHFRREHTDDPYKNYPEIHIIREFQVIAKNFFEIHELFNKGVIVNYTLETSQYPKVSILLRDNETKVEENGWMLQGQDYKWFSLSDHDHTMLMKYGKIIIGR